MRHSSAVIAVAFVALIGLRAETPWNDVGTKRFSLSANYLGGSIGTVTQPHTWSSTEVQDQRGVDATAQIMLGSVAFGYRHQWLDLSRPVDAVAARDYRRGKEIYHEAFGSVLIPKSGHRLLGGAARFGSQTEWSASVPVVSDKFRTLKWGPVVGLAGEQGLGRFRFEYSGRGYPYLRRSDGWVGLSNNLPSSSWGLELRGSVAYALTERLRWGVGYQYRYVSTPAPVAYWPERQTTKGFFTGLGLSF